MRPVPEAWGYDLAACGRALVRIYRSLGDERQRVRSQRIADAGNQWLARNARPLSGPAADAATGRIGEVDDSPQTERRILLATHLAALSLTLADDMLGGHRLVPESIEARSQARITAKVLPIASAAIRTAFDGPIADGIIEESAMGAALQVLDTIGSLAMARYSISRDEVMEAVTEEMSERAEAMGMPPEWVPAEMADEAAS